MRFLRNASIQRKQTLIIMLTSGVALLVACAAFMIYDALTFRSELARNTSTLAVITGNNCTAAIDFNDSATAAETLAALSGEEHIVAACAYDRHGKPFAVYLRDPAGVSSIPPLAQAPGHQFQDNHLRLFHRVKQGKDTIGTIFLESDSEGLSARLARFASIVTLVFLASLIIAFTLSRRLQRLISGPVLHLAEIARSVAENKDYSLRATKQSEDELGQLIDGFNAMLAQIQERDAALQANRDRSEERVAVRTRELAHSLSLLNATIEAGVDGILAVDREGRITCCNQQFAQLWGYPSEVIGRSDAEELLMFAALQVTDAEAFVARVRQAQASPEIATHDTFEFKDGRVVERITKPQFLGEKCVGIVITYRDITERKRSEGLQQRTEELYRRAITGAGAVPYLYDYETRAYAFMGAGIEQLIGYAPQEMIPDVWQTIVAESIMLGETAGLEKDEATRRVAMGEIRQWRCDMRVITRDGKSRWISDVSVQDLDEAGKPKSSMGILQDITERKQAEIAATAFSKLSRELSSAASRKEAARIISEVSSDLFGWDACWIELYSEKDDTVHSILEMDTIHGQRTDVTVPSSRKATDMHHRILKAGAELILRDPAFFLSGGGGGAAGDGSRPSASLMLVPVRYGNQSVGILSVQSFTPLAYTKQDLATIQTLADHCGGALERIRADEAWRESESQFRLVWNTSADGMRLTNHDGTVLMANDAYCLMVDKAKSDVEGQPISVINSRECAAQVLCRYREGMASNTIEPHLETEVILWNGRKVWFEVSNSLLELAGQPALLLSVFRDATRRKQAEAQLDAMHRELLDASRQAGMAEVATNVLHNVGNVLNSVNTSANVVADRLRNFPASALSRLAELLEQNRHDLAAFLTTNGRTEQVTHYVKTLSQHLAAEQTAALTELRELTTNIEHIKEIVAMQQNYIRVSGVTEMVKVTDLVEDALRMNVDSLERHEVQLIREYAPELPLITVEKHKVLQILVNLIRNAKHACEDSGLPDRRLTLQVTNGNKHVRIAVADNGVGIPAENLTRIFNHGFTTRANGNGFGLHSGALAARELGGSLTACSDGPGRGATFTLELPV